MKTWETLAKEFLLIWNQQQTDTPIVDKLRERAEEFRKRTQQLVDEVQKKAQADCESLLAAAKQNTLKECEHKTRGVTGIDYNNGKIKIHTCRCDDCGKDFPVPPQPDTITIDGHTYTPLHLWDAAYAIVNAEAGPIDSTIIAMFKSALQKVQSDKGEV